MVTYAAVEPNISARRALVRRPITPAKKQVKSTIIPTITAVLWSETWSKHTMAPTRSIALRKMEMTAPAR